ncbi:hypothetical protein DPMN_053147 [Dreissena polymorpha]|uniref:DDE-1 domain-containing protein n=1 Tax=Dreissena polymorpha TaxID=45954 RepID=A0A9D4CKU8_DREPO|nr:hypothetical protein DPMN_053147 [Dreissena polymorpha]
MLPELMVGKSEEAEGMMTQSGWSNSEVFLRYMKTHFLKYDMGRNQEYTTLVLYYGQKSHISIKLIEWAKENTIVLFALSPHCSHIFSPCMSVVSVHSKRKQPGRFNILQTAQPMCDLVRCLQICVQSIHCSYVACQLASIVQKDWNLLVAECH